MLLRWAVLSVASAILALCVGKSLYGYMLRESCEMTWMFQYPQYQVSGDVTCEAGGWPPALGSRRVCVTEPPVASCVRGDSRSPSATKRK